MGRAPKPSEQLAADAPDALADTELRQLLQIIQNGDDADHLVDNEAIARALGWTPTKVAASLAEARERSYIWGSRNGLRPAPSYTDLEVTVQGRRFLAANGAPAKARATRTGQK